jgi:hypothetical protein
MDRVLRVIADYQWWLYGLLALLVLFYLRRAFLARRQGARSIFKLEQEQARGRYLRSVVVTIIILVILAAVFGTTNLLIPSLQRTPEPTATVTTGPLSEPTLTTTPPPPTITPTVTATRVLPTRAVMPTGTPQSPTTPTPLVRPPSCPNPGARITSPGMNQAVIGDVSVRGSASISDFHYFKIEVAPGPNPVDGQWTVVGELHYIAVEGGVLETFNSGAYPPGIYTLRLVVVDRTGNFPDPCRVTVTVQR